MSLPKSEYPIKTNSTLSDSLPFSRCAILTGSGRSAVAGVGVQGAAAADAIADRFTPTTIGPFKAGQIRFGQWGGESIVVTPIAQQSYEIHCHGGPLAAKRIVQDLAQAGIQAVPADGWNVDHVPLLIREAQDVLGRCQTARTAAIALDQTRGKMFDWCEGLIAELRKIDLEDLPKEIRERIQMVAKRGAVGTRIDRPFRVVLAGPPNVGKSSLVNAIVGYDRSITMDIAGTTRDVLHAETVIDGFPIRLSDTAGMRDSAEPIERQGIEFAKKAAIEADLVVLVSDPENAMKVALPFHHSIHVMNKADLIKDKTQIDGAAIPTTATTGEGVAELMQAIAATLADHFPALGEPVPVTARQLECLNHAFAANTTSQAIQHLDQLLFGC